MDKFLSLKHYDNISICMLRYNNIAVNSENISSVNEMMMKADMKYLEGVTGSTRQDFRILYAVYAIKNIRRRYAKSMKKSIFVSIEDKYERDRSVNQDFYETLGYRELFSQVESDDIFNKINESSNLSDKDKRIIKEVMFSYCNMTEVSKTLGVSRQNINITLKRLKEKAPWIKDLL